MPDNSGVRMARGRWFRVYDDVLDDPKVQRLNGELFKTWLNLLCLASKTGGIIPSTDDLAFRLRISTQDAATRIDELILAGLIDILPNGTRTPHKWDERQFPSDSSAPRMRKLRSKRKAKTACDVTCDTVGEASDAKSDALDEIREDTEVEIDKSNPTQEEELNLLPLEQDATRESEVKFKFDFGGIGLGGGVTKPIGPEALRRAAQRANVADASPLLEAFDAWPVSRKARDREALFVSSAAKLLANASDDVRRRCAPIEDEIKPKPVRPSRELVAALQRGGRHGR